MSQCPAVPSSLWGERAGTRTRCSPSSRRRWPGGSGGDRPRPVAAAKKAAYGATVRRLNSLEDTCVEMAMSHFDGEDYFRFPEVYQSIEREDAEGMLRRWCVPERTDMAVIRPKDSRAEQNK